MAGKPQHLPDAHSELKAQISQVPKRWGSLEAAVAAANKAQKPRRNVREIIIESLLRLQFSGGCGVKKKTVSSWWLGGGYIVLRGRSLLIEIKQELLVKDY